MDPYDLPSGTFINSPLKIRELSFSIDSGGVNVSYSPHITNVGTEILFNTEVVSVLPWIASKIDLVLEVFLALAIFNAFIKFRIFLIVSSDKVLVAKFLETFALIFVNVFNSCYTF